MQPSNPRPTGRQGPSPRSNPLRARKRERDERDSEAQARETAKRFEAMKKNQEAREAVTRDLHVGKSAETAPAEVEGVDNSGQRAPATRLLRSRAAQYMAAHMAAHRHQSKSRELQDKADDKDDSEHLRGSKKAKTAPPADPVMDSTGALNASDLFSPPTSPRVQQHDASADSQLSSAVSTEGDSSDLELELVDEDEESNTDVLSEALS